MDMEQYEEAVRDYEKVYQTEKTSGTFYLNHTVYPLFSGLPQSHGLRFYFNFLAFLQTTSSCWRGRSWSWRRVRGKTTTRSWELARTPPRMRSRRPIANAPSCTTQVRTLGINSGVQDDEMIFISRKVLIMFASPLCPADRHSAATPEVQKEEEKKFKEVGEAFTVLSDPKKKVRYDNGHDLDDDCGFDGRGMCCLSHLSLHKSAGHMWDWRTYLCSHRGRAGEQRV